MPRISLINQHAMNRTIANLEGVKGAVRRKAEEIGVKAERRLASHRDTGVAKIEVEHDFEGKYGHIDSLVSLVDPDNAVAIEFGHQLYINGQRTNRYIPGLYIVRGAAGLA